MFKHRWITYLLLSPTLAFSAPSSHNKQTTKRKKTSSKRLLKDWKEDYAYRIVGRICHPDSIFSHCSTLKFQNCVTEVKRNSDSCLELATPKYRKKRYIRWSERRKGTQVVSRCLSRKIAKFKSSRSNKCLSYIQSLKSKKR